MRVAILSSVVFLMGAGVALAGPGSGEPKQPADPPSGRPAAILDDAKCSSLWSGAQKSGDALTEGQAAPFVANFKLVDANADGKISQAEFKEGCKQGLVQEAAASPQPSGTESPRGGQQPAGSTSPSPSQQ